MFGIGKLSYVKIGCVIFCSKNLCTHTNSVKIVFNYYPYAKGTQKYWDLHCIHTQNRRIIHRIRYEKIWGIDPFLIVQSQIIAEIKIYTLLHIIVNHRSLLYSKVNYISKGLKWRTKKRDLCQCYTRAMYKNHTNQV